MRWLLCFCCLTLHAADIQTVLESAHAGSIEAQMDMARRYAEGDAVVASPDMAAWWLTQAASRGHAPAQLALGLRYLHGDGVERAPEDAERWLQQAAEQGLAAAQSAYGTVLLERDPDAAKRWLTRAALAGQADAAVRLGFWERKSGDQSQSARWFARAAAAGDAGACYELSRAYRFGLGLAPSALLAQRWLTRASEGGHLTARYELAEAVLNRYPLSTDPNELTQALDHVRASAQGGLAGAQRLLGLCYLRGQVVGLDAVRGHALLEQAAQGGDSEAALYLGRDAQHSAPERERYLRQAADGGSALAMAELGQLLELGLSGAVRVSEAFALYQQAIAVREEPLALVRLGLLYRRGFNAQASQSLALEYFRRAAAQGSAAAQELLGEAALQGDGLPQDMQSARVWFEQAAEGGRPTAMQQLAQLYLEGRGLAGPDPDRACAWLREAVELGHGPAAQQLGDLAASGLDVVPALGSAATWYERAAAMGVPEAREALRRYKP